MRGLTVMQVVRLEEAGLRERLAEPLRGAVALARRERWRRSQPWPGFGEPFNGQAARKRVVTVLLEAFRPDAIIETGTFMGFTTRDLAAEGVNTYTVEIDPGYAWLARQALKDLKNVTLIRGDSARAVTMLAGDGAIRRPLAYLDAHWEERVPLQEEIDELAKGWSEFVAVIDDFRVPDEPGYGYDVYDDVPLSRDQLFLPEGVEIAYPAAGPLEETGSRRGTAYLAWGDSAVSALRVAAAGDLVVIASGEA